MGSSDAALSGTIVKVKPSDAAFAPVTSTADGRINESVTDGSLVNTSKVLAPVVSASTVKDSSVELELAGTMELRIA